jgi:tetratricopeptide (TPR) repeat protein
VGAWGEPPQRPARSDRLVEALQQALMHSRAEGLRVLAIDDLQRADDASLKLIVPALLATPELAVVFSLQPAARPRALQSAVDECPKAFEIQRLQAMSAQAMAQLIGALPLRLAHQQAWGEVLASRSLGNPMHAIEWLRHLQLQHGNAVFLEPPRATDEHTDEPFALLLEERLARLPPSARHLAQWAALAGVLFDAALAQGLTGHSLPRLGDDWLHLRHENIFDERGLAHDALREPLLRPLPAGLLREMQAQIASLCAGRSAPAAALAPHWRAAGRWREAAECFGEAAASALSMGASDTACTLFDEAAAAHEQAGARAEAFGARLLALEAARASREHSETEQRASELLARAGELDATARAAALEARARVDMSRWDFGAALQSADAAWAEAERSREAAPASSPEASGGVAGKLALRIRACRAGALAGLGRMAEAQTLVDEDREAVRLSGDERLMMDHAGMHGYVLLHGSRVLEAERALREALAIAHRLDDAAETMTLASNAAQTVLRQGRTREALDLALDAVIESRRLGRASGVAVGSALITAGGIRLQIGQYRQALQDFDGAQQALGSALPGAWLDGTTSFRVQTLVELGQAEKAIEVLEARHAEVADAPTQKPRFRLVFARYVIDKALGKRTEAELIETLRALQAMTPHADAALGFVVQNELALWLPAEEALELARDVALRASEKGFLSAHAAARVRAAQALVRLGKADEAHGVMQAVLQELPTCQPLFITLPTLWWVAGEVADAAGMSGHAAQAWRRGRAWLMEQALPNVPGGLQESFLDGHPVHRRLNAAGRE